MNKQTFEDHIKTILDNHDISLDNDEGTADFGRGDHKELTDTVFRGGDSHLTINEDGEQLGGISFNVEDDVEIEDRDVKLINNSDATEHLVPEGIAIAPNTAVVKELRHSDVFGEGKQGVGVNLSSPKQITTLEDLAVAHPYYCNTANFFNNDATGHFETCKEFLENFGDMDLDMNHCFRWDVTLKEEDQPERGYKAFVFLILQRKGIFTPITIDSIHEEDVEPFVAYLQKHADHHKMMWLPFV